MSNNNMFLDWLEEWAVGTIFEIPLFAGAALFRFFLRLLRILLGVDD